MNKLNLYDTRLAKEIEVYAVSCLSEILVSDQRLNDIKVQQCEDVICNRIRQFVKCGWSSYLSNLDTNFRPN